MTNKEKTQLITLINKLVDLPVGFTEPTDTRIAAETAVERISNRLTKKERELLSLEKRVFKVEGKPSQIFSNSEIYRDITQELESLRQGDSIRRGKILRIENWIMASSSVDKEKIKKRIKEDPDNIDRWTATNHCVQNVSTLCFNSLRVLNIIEKLNIESIGDLICYSSNVLLAQPNFGVRSLAVIETALSEINLKLAE